MVVLYIHDVVLKYIRADFKKGGGCVLLKRLRDPETVYLNKVNVFTKHFSWITSLIFVKPQNQSAFNPFSTNVPFTDEPGSQFLLAKCY